MDNEGKVDRNGKLLLGWFMPVNYLVLGARIESYAATKAQITTLQYCVKYAASSQAISKLTFELLNIISVILREDEMQIRYEQWVRADICMRDACRPSSHLSRRRIRSITGRDPSDSEFNDYDLHGHWESIHCAWANSQVETMRYSDQKRMMVYSDAYKTFRKVEEEFSRKFGVKFHFKLDRNPQNPKRYTHVTAYLVIPKETIEIESGFNWSCVFLRVESEMNLKALTPLSEESKHQFRIAAKTIGVKARLNLPFVQADLGWLTDSEDDELEGEEERSDDSVSWSSLMSLPITKRAVRRASRKGARSDRTNLRLKAFSEPETPEENMDNWPKFMMIGNHRYHVPDRN